MFVRIDYTAPQKKLCTGYAIDIFYILGRAVDLTDWFEKRVKWVKKLPPFFTNISKPINFSRKNVLKNCNFCPLPMYCNFIKPIHSTKTNFEIFLALNLIC